MNSRKRPKQITLTSFFSKKPKSDQNNLRELNESVENAENPTEDSQVPAVSSAICDLDQNNNSVCIEVDLRAESSKQLCDRNYVPEWFAMFGVMKLDETDKSKLQCVICKYKFDSIRGSVLRKHYDNQHKLILEQGNNTMTDKIPPYKKSDKVAIQKRTENFVALKKKNDDEIQQQKHSMQKYLSHKSILRMAADNIALEVARNKWSFCDGERVSFNFCCLILTID